MILRQYINDGITNVLAVTFFIIAILSFGYAEYFDRIFLGYIMILSIFYIKKPNVLSLLSIILFERIVEEVIFYANSLEYAKPWSYFVSAFLIHYFWYDKVVKRAIFPLVSIVILIEMYWYVTGYPAPSIHFYIWMIWLNVITRHLIFLRVPIVKKYFSKNVEHASIDWQLYSIYRWFIVMIIIMICEYLIRHLTPANPMLIYDNYRYPIQLLSLVVLYFITKFVILDTFKFKA